MALFCTMNIHHEELVFILFERIKLILEVPELSLKIMKRRGSKSDRRYILGYINLGKKLITLDIYTPKTVAPKSLNSMIRTLAHEVAHYQKQPYRQRIKRRWILRQHYPEFYQQVNSNIQKIREDKTLNLHFEA
jgi:hypothetical protein